MASICRLTAPTYSTPTELENDANVSVSGAPTHTPRRARQTATEPTTNVVYEWYDNAWHGEGF